MAKIRKKVKRTEHEYRKRMLLSIKLGIIDKPMLILADVMHDDPCDFFKGKFCNCDPDIIIDADGGTFALQKDGTLERFGGGE
jgi:hypothetical protein